MSAIINREENPFDFELRALQLARALHDAAGTQGSMIILGQERDGVFVSHDDINVYEFTTEHKKEKAIKDAEKLAQLLAYLHKDRANALKPMTGWFVTRDEPTGDQRSAVASVAKRTSRTIHAISVAQMYKRICNSEMYLQARDKAPFGSTSFTPDTPGKVVRVPVQLASGGGLVSSIQEVSDRLAIGGRVLVVGDYGAGKSHALRDLYVALRKEHFKRCQLTPFPLHINLRDCAGLRTPSEILRRHAEEIGFDHANGLISAWRAGMCVLLLDGFDEVLPNRWLGSVADLKNVRWEALAPIRRLVEETPETAGVIVAGRSHYFSSQAEMTSALGFKPLEILSIPDFNETQLADYLHQSKATWTLPDWVPARPLLLGYLVSLGTDSSTSIAASVTRAEGWRTFLSEICVRESKMFSAVRPEIIEQIISRVATLARAGSSAIGPISTDQLTAAFVSVNGFQPDNEGIQLLLRLPGLTASFGPGGGEMRSFADSDLAETAYGLDLASLVVNPYDERHPLGGPASWVNASYGLGTEVAADALLSQQYSTGSILAVLTRRQDAGQHDAVLADLIGALTAMPWEREKVPTSYLISGVAFEDFDVIDHPVLAATTLQDCLVERLDLANIDDQTSIPQFKNCVISFVDGLSSIPDRLSAKFTGSEVLAFSSASQTTAGIMQLRLDRESLVALTVLKKIFSQRGSARKEGALSRGLSLSDRAVVPTVLAEMVSQGWIRHEGQGNNVLYVGAKERRKDALRALEAPGEFKLR